MSGGGCPRFSGDSFARALNLFRGDPLKHGELPPSVTNQSLAATSQLEKLLHFSATRLRPHTFYLISILLGALSSVVLLSVLSPYFAPLFFLLGAGAPLTYIRKRASQRAHDFTADLPTVLLAAASSLRVGMTPLLALERSVKLLPPANLVRAEVALLARRLNQGVTKQQAVQRFGEQIDAPDIELFRSALLLAMDHGGRFGPTLEKLALVCKERTTLVRAARVTTSIMNMTANCLLLMTPLIIALVSSRTERYFVTFRENSTANTIATFGAVMVIGGYLALRRMSAFRP